MKTCESETLLASGIEASRQPAHGFRLSAKIQARHLERQAVVYFYSIIFLEQRRGALRPVISWSIAPPPCGGLNDGHERGSVNSNS